MPDRPRILIVAHQTADSPELREAVARRAAQGDAKFTLFVPALAHGLHQVMNPEEHGRDEAQSRLDEALPVLSEAAGEPVDGMIGSHEVFVAVQDALNLDEFDEVIVSMLPARISKWLHLDLPHRVRALGVPVTEVVGPDASGIGARRRAAKMDRAPSVEARSQGAATVWGLRFSTPAAPGGDRLRLLPSGPDLVHSSPPRRDRTITAPDWALTPGR